MLAEIFGPPSEWPDQDLIAITSADLDPELVLAAYCSGAFPMPLHESNLDGYMCWWSPVHRGVIDPENVPLRRSLRKTAKRYLTSVDTAFTEVLEACADPRRPDGWIDQTIKTVYTQLHQMGYAHSVETWDREGRLVGGLYGVSIGGLFAGESMFHDDQYGRDASKVALVRLAQELLDQGCRLLDVQWATDHLKTMGAEEISRDEYLSRLSGALEQQKPKWKTGKHSIRALNG